MDRFVIEVVNARKDGPAYLHPGVLVERDGVKQIEIPAAGILLLTPNTLDADTRVQLTSEQFRNYSHDLECFSEGLKGCERTIRLDLRNVATGERERVTFEQASKVVAAGVNSDADALADQEQQAAELERLASDLDEEDEQGEATE